MSGAMTRVRRAMLFMPGDDLKKIQKGATSGVDSVIMDLEDGVALNNKRAARQTILESLQTLDFGRSEKLVRINPVDSGLEMADIETTLEGRPDGYVIPKVENARQIRLIGDALAKDEAMHGFPVGSTLLFAIIETPMGVINLREIAAASKRLAGLMFGAEDLAGALGAIRTPESTEVLYARSQVVLYARAYDLQAIDTPYVDIHNLEGLEADTRQALQLGYDGKLTIHPKHVPVIESVFQPTPEAVENAHALIAAHDAHQAEGKGVFSFEGRMVDMPMIRAAERVLARAGLPYTPA